MKDYTIARNFLIKKSTYEKLKKLSAETGKSISELVRDAITKYLESKNGKM